MCSGPVMRNERRLLVIDDDDAIRSLLFTIFRRRGYKVDTARNGVEALERLASCRYSLIVLDLMMPMMNGYELLGRLAQEPRSDRPVVLVLTAGTEPRNLDPEVVAGTMRKPFDIQLLLDTVAACLASIGDREQSTDCPSAESERRPISAEDKPN